MDIVISYLNFNLKYHDKYTFVVKLISLANTCNLFSLEVVQKCQHCQLCVLRENSIGYRFDEYRLKIGIDFVAYIVIFFLKFWRT